MTPAGSRARRRSGFVMEGQHDWRADHGHRDTGRDRGRDGGVPEVSEAMSFQESRLLPPVGRIRIHVATATRTFSIDGDLSLHPALFDEIVADMLRRLTPEGGTP